MATDSNWRPETCVLAEPVRFLALSCWFLLPLLGTAKPTALFPPIQFPISGGNPRWAVVGGWWRTRWAAVCTAAAVGGVCVATAQVSSCNHDGRPRRMQPALLFFTLYFRCITCLSLFFFFTFLCYIQYIQPAHALCVHMHSTLDPVSPSLIIIYIFLVWINPHLGILG